MENEASLESTMDADLAALLGPESKSGAAASVAGKGTKAVAGDKPGEIASSPPVDTPSGDDEEDPLLKALDALGEEGEEKKEGEEGKEGDEPKAALSDDQQAVLSVIPNIQTATNLYNVVENYNTFTTAMAEGKFEDVESMLVDWNPEVMDKWLEHIYKKHGEALVDRFINENDPNAPKENKDIVALRKKVQSLEEAVVNKKKVTVQETEADRTKAGIQKYNVHVNELFDKIEFNKNDRRWVVADLNNRIAADPKLYAAVKAGDIKGVLPVFKAACKEYLNRDKEVVEKKGEKIKAQEKKKLPIGSGAGGEGDVIPEDIKSVKKGDEDAWLDKTLNGFLGKVLGRK
jgi:hypothetical protein